MKLRNRLILLAVTITVGVGACASGGGARLYQRDLGTASAPDLTRIVAYVLQRFHYEVADQDGEPVLRWETYWQPRTPFTDESELGITGAETRIIVTGRSRSETQVTLYTSRLVVENRVRVANDGVWSDAINTPMFQVYADSVAEEFRTEFTKIGVRRY
jgi:hypothetical protein